MIVQCENCGSRFEVDQNLLGTKGRKLKCSRCKHIFFQAAPSAEAGEEQPVATLPPVVAPVVEAPAETAPPAEEESAVEDDSWMQDLSPEEEPPAALSPDVEESLSEADNEALAALLAEEAESGADSPDEDLAAALAASEEEGFGSAAEEEDLAALLSTTEKDAVSEEEDDLLAALAAAEEMPADPELTAAFDLDADSDADLQAVLATEMPSQAFEAEEPAEEVVTEAPAEEDFSVDDLSVDEPEISAGAFNLDDFSDDEPEISAGAVDVDDPEEEGGERSFPSLEKASAEEEDEFPVAAAADVGMDAGEINGLDEDFGAGSGAAVGREVDDLSDADLERLLNQGAEGSASEEDALAQAMDDMDLGDLSAGGNDDGSGLSADLMLNEDDLQALDDLEAGGQQEMDRPPTTASRKDTAQAWEEEDGDLQDIVELDEVATRPEDLDRDIDLDADTMLQSKPGGMRRDDPVFDHLGLDPVKDMAWEMPSADHEAMLSAHLDGGDHVWDVGKETPPSFLDNASVRSKVWLVAALLLLVLVGGYGYRSGLLASFLSGKGGSGPFAVVRAEASWQGSEFAPLLRVDGLLRNEEKRSQRAQMVKVSLVDAAGKNLVSGRAVPDRVLTGTDLSSEEKVLRDMLALQSNVERLKVPKVGPRDEMPFQVVFIDPPQEAVNFRVDFEEVPKDAGPKPK
ncbi:MAG: zinc-ribbon domain-containing protein [Magnetococcales bacterium]|nr:zinc-ribbon domain-containing protein [Magnetococcales bacterium]